MIGELVPPSVFKTGAGREASWVGSIPIRPRQASWAGLGERDPHFESWQERESVDSWLTNDDARAPLLRWARGLLPYPADAALAVLDVGAGYGAFAQQILEAYPRSAVCLQDFSDPMIAEATRRLSRFAGRVNCHMSDLRDPEWADDASGPYDAVISSYTIHGLPDPTVIPRLYREFCRLLRPGGCFLNIDLILYPPETSALAGIYHTNDPGQPVHHGEDEEGDEHTAEPPTLEDHLRWLRQSGFGEADCVWKRLRRAVLCAVRTS
jgi:tRNA (cmo5U34)-methyltransferase